MAESGTPTPVPVLVPPDQCTSYQALLTRLVQGPNQDQETDGFFSAIPGGTVVLAVTPRTVGDKPPSGPIVVDFNNSFGEVAGTEQVLAVEQIVHTIDVLDAGAEVLFEIDGQPIEVPLQNGAQVPRARVRPRLPAARAGDDDLLMAQAGLRLVPPPRRGARSTRGAPGRSRSGSARRTRGRRSRRSP